MDETHEKQNPVCSHGVGSESFPPVPIRLSQNEHGNCGDEKGDNREERGERREILWYVLGIKVKRWAFVRPPVIRSDIRFRQWSRALEVPDFCGDRILEPRELR